MNEADRKPGMISIWWIVAVAAFVAAIAAGCYSPVDSQRYFAQAAAKDQSLELIHRTALYSVFYDHALRRCVMHSAHTWGQHGGGGGGTGVGIAAFRCDPVRIKERVKLLNLQIEDIRDPGETPAWEKLDQQPEPKKTAKTAPHAAAGGAEEVAPPVAPEPYGEGQ